MRNKRNFRKILFKTQINSKSNGLRSKLSSTCHYVTYAKKYIFFYTKEYDLAYELVSEFSESTEKGKNWDVFFVLIE